MSFQRGDLIFVVASAAPGGKTMALSALMGELRAAGLHPVALKPVETSCPVLDNHDIGTRDGEVLGALNGGLVPRPVIVPYRLRGEGSPASAARAAGLDLRLADLTATLSEAARYGDVLVIEVAGPVLGPIAEDGSALDWAESLAAKLVLVIDRAPAKDQGSLRVLEAATRKRVTVIERVAV